MKKKLLTIFMFVATGAFLGAAAHAETVAVKKVIEVPGATRQQLILRASTWSERSGQSYKADEKAGVVVADASIAYPSPPIGRIQYSNLFTVRNNVENGKVTVTFEDVRLKSPATYLPADTGAGPAETAGKVEPVKSGKDIVAVNKTLNYVANNLEDFLQNKTETACPMQKCPDCGMLTTSPKEMKQHMKEHMKIHGGHE